MCVVGAMSAYAVAPSGYYTSAQGKNKGNLLKALESLVGEHKTISYSGLWDLYHESDVTADGYIWDMYSTVKFTPGKNQCGNYSSVGDCYNREHSFPKSWFDDQSPMYSDAFHIYPTDGKVNGQRSNYPYGECANGNTLSSTSKGKPLGRLGNSTFSGYSGTVFEPDDQYKGDFARSYFYMAAAYNSRIDEWSSAQLAGNSYPCFSSWSVNLLMKWHREDPVSQKEIDRNEVVYRNQGNRNPFIDHPELAEYVWGTKKDEGWTPGGVSDPIIISPDANETYDCGVVSKGKSVTIAVPLQTTGITEELTARIQNANFTVSPGEVSVAEAKAGITLKVTFAPVEAGTHTAKLEIYNGEVGTEVTVKGECVDGIPALTATNVTFDGFTARWTDVDNGTATYKLTVFEDDAVSVVLGYPVNVQSSKQEYKVSGLNYESDYYYQLSCDDRVSNVVKVKTASPHRILAFTSVPEGGLRFSSAPGEASSVQEMSIYTEYITEKIRVSVSGQFELSMNNSDWSQTLDNIDPEGETFYVRMKAIATEGKYTGVLSLSTSSMDGEELDVTGTVAAPRAFFEDFEVIPDKTGYYTGVYQGTACKWNFVSTGVYGRSGDHYKGTQAVCTGKNGKATISMAEDKPNGLGRLTFLAACYGSDEAAGITVSYSVNGGNSWIELGKETVSATSLTEYGYTVNVTGDVRIKIEQTSGKRLNIDDISITDFNASSAIENVGIAQWLSYSTVGGLVIDTPSVVDVEIYSMDAVKVCDSRVEQGKTVVPLEKGIYIVVSGDVAKKVIVK